MRPAPEPAIRLSSTGHCCVCAGVCHHIGPIQLCPAHRAPTTNQKESQ